MNASAPNMENPHNQIKIGHYALLETLGKRELINSFNKDLNFKKKHKKKVPEVLVK